MELVDSVEGMRIRNINSRVVQTGTDIRIKNYKRPPNRAKPEKKQRRKRRKRRKRKMASQLQEEKQLTRPKAIKVDSVETWDLYVSQATNQGCPIIAHFTASWCMPSVAMNSFFEEIASEYSVVLFLTVDVDEVKEVATRLEIKAMPTFLLMREGGTVEKLVGANPEEIRKRIEGFVQSIRVDVA